ncbi:GNAT family N-acetyltransferase [Segniliparus rugosus]|uniref:GNAT family N-acetyltransferase n=1 Tax=Segniliparus rugosus TaxID=286804 RepID=UPI00058C2DC2|nr:GNAT family N-acetyltransferase [Segniliparus rugosus]
MPKPGRLVVRHVPWAHPDAQLLRDAMAAEVGPRYAARRTLLPPEASGHNDVDPETVHATLVAYSEDGAPVGHAALRWNDGELELKRMFVAAQSRGTGVAQALLRASEESASAAGSARLILQTGDLQPDAVRLYEKEGYHRIPRFPPYTHELLAYSNCFAKNLLAL